MRHVYYLPEAVTAAEAQKLYRLQEEARQPGKILAYLDDSEVEVIHRAVSRLSDVLKKCKRATTIVTWSIDQLGNLDEFHRHLAVRHYDSVRVRVLTPDLLFDPVDENSMRIIAAMAVVQKKARSDHHNGNVAGSTPAFGQAPIDEALVKIIRDERARGVTQKKIAMKHKVSINTVAKYTRDIKVPIGLSVQKKRESLATQFDYIKARSRIDFGGGEGSEEALTLFFNFLRHQRTDATRETYFFDIRDFAGFYVRRFGPIVHPRQFSEHEMQAYHDFIRERGYAQSMFRRRLSALSSWLTFCRKRGFITTNVASLIKLPKIDPHKVISIGLERRELQEMLRYALTEYKTQVTKPQQRALAHRNFVVLYLLSTTGMRVGSLVQLRKKDVTTRDGVTYLELFGKKRGDTYTVSVDDKTAAILDNYITSYLADASPETPLIFARFPKSGKAFCRHEINRMIGRFAEHIGIKRKVTAHSFRVSFATLHTKDGMHIKELQRRMNHKDINQTAAYIQLAETKAVTGWLADFSADLPAPLPSFPHSEH